MAVRPEHALEAHTRRRRLPLGAVILGLALAAWMMVLAGYFALTSSFHFLLSAI